MQRLLSSALAFLFVAALGTSMASAATCRDNHGRFIKCRPVVVKTVRCRDSHGRFMKCKTVMHHM
jgi:hypothetical protein